MECSAAPSPETTALAALQAALPPADRGSQGVAFDGNVQRGRLAFAAAGGATVHALTAYRHEADTVLAQEAIHSTAEKAEAELTVAPALVAPPPPQNASALTGNHHRLTAAVCYDALMVIVAL